MQQFALQRPPPIEQLKETNLVPLFQYLDRISKFTRQITTAKPVTADYTLEAEVYWVRVDATSGAVTVTLPPVGNVGRPVGVIKTDSSANAITIDGNGSETINGVTTQSLASQYDVLTLRDNGTSWDIEIRINASVTAISGLTPTDGNFIVGNGTTWVAESGATARTSLGLGTLATQNANNVSITGGAVDVESLTTDAARLNNQLNYAKTFAGTLTNAPRAGDPAYWAKINIDGTEYAFPCWILGVIDSVSGSITYNGQTPTVSIS